jgi:hypothetical protein
MYALLSLRILIYNIFVNVFIPFVVQPAVVTRFGISATQVTALNNFLTDWNLKYAAYISPLTYGRVAINAIHLAFLKGYPLTQSIRTKIKTDTTITLTSEEMEICDIKAPDTSRTPSKIPKSSPALACFMISYLLMRFVVIDPLLLFKKAKPKGIVFIGYRTAITDAGAPAPKPEDYKDQEAVTETQFEMVFTADQIGKTLYIIAYYMNSKMEAGPDGIPVMVTIG